MYLLFGTKKILLIDSGATVSLTSFPIRQHVETIINRWCINKKKKREDLKLVVAHTHNHLDHIAGDGQFQGQLFTTVVGTTVENVSYFFKLSKWPYSIGTFALDNQRQVAIIPIPGHENASIAFYDCTTGLLFTGDSLLPGRLYIANFSANVDSIQRLLYFIESNHLNVSAILGAHIEMTQIDKVDYPIGATYQPKERLLNLSLDHLHQLNNELQEQWKAGFDQRHKAYYDAFIVDPNPSQLPPYPSNGRMGEHGFILLPLSTLGLVWISHKPMFRTPHDFQLVLIAKVTHPNVNSLSLPTNTNVLQNQWTILPDLWSLNNLLNGNMTTFSAQLFIGNFEQGGQYLCNITLEIVWPPLTIVQLNASEIEPYQPLRYSSYLLSNMIVNNQTEIHLYLLHQIRVQPDFDTIAHATIDPFNCTTDIEREKLVDLLTKNGNEWAFPGLNNELLNRLTVSSGVVRAQLLNDIYSTVCSMSIIEEIQCTLGPDFYDNCHVTSHSVCNSSSLLTILFFWLCFQKEL
ncbi:unnamed protein product [Rotaria sordida]|uniref:Metallo-beta-lactamase domain-containing protein n=1 Tax=Rotaria sordida TaxID=392033 RepID=A0A813S388_9BILA|nr:unnamed protein product [Rotaria sordida]CAF0877884.1 unnamed protein product [Rotaria sordida]